MTGRQATSPAAALAALLLALGAAGCRGVNIGWDVGLERMLAQPSYRAFRTGVFFEDRAVLQPPPTGTISREQELGPARVVRGYDAAGPADRIPIPMTRAMIDEGRASFETICGACHGVLGNAITPVADRMQLRRPPSLHRPDLRALPDGRIFQVIREGYGLMPAYADQLSVREAWEVVAYLRALQLSQATSLDSLPAPARAAALHALGAAPLPGAPATPDTLPPARGTAPPPGPVAPATPAPAGGRTDTARALRPRGTPPAPAGAAAASPGRGHR